MKKVILIFALTLMSLSFIDCNKKTTIVPISQPVYCVWIEHTNSPRTFYKCVETDAEMQQLNIQLRNANIEHVEFRKATCAECK